MQIKTNSWTDIREKSPKVALLPIGSTEQHGPHAPIGTDTIIARNIATEVDKYSECNTIVLPTIPVGIAPYHSHFPGTLSVSMETFRQYVHDILNSLSDSTIEIVVFVNGHGGNSETLGNLARIISDDSMVDLKVFLWEWIRVLDESVSHAGEIETSILFYLCPNIVSEPVVGDADTWNDTFDGGVYHQFTDDFSENGVVGDATDATTKQGEARFETTVDALISFLNHLIDAEFGSNNQSN